jgi:sugar lactone lactonase YvrE
MFQRLQMMSRAERLVIFILIFGGGLMLLVALTIFLLLHAINTAPRVQAFASVDGITVTEFAALPDDDAYPAAVTVTADGVVYTASYATGAVWALGDNGQAVELPGTREQIGSVTGLAAGPDGTLYILDRIDYNPRAAGGMIWRVTPDGRLAQFGVIDDTTGFVSPFDIAADPYGYVYVSDRGRRAVWRFDRDGAGVPWWQIPADDAEIETAIPTGLAYDPAHDAIIVTDAEADTVYRVALDGHSSEIVYRYTAARDAPTFIGVTVSPEGAIYVAARSAGEVVRVDGGELITLAENFRGVNDVDFHAGRLYATNFDQRSLILPGLQPQLPFALDVIDLAAGPVGG